MHKLTTKIIAVVLVLTMAIGGLVINTSAYSMIAGIVDIVHILTDLKVTDGPIGSDVAQKIASDLGVDGVKKLVSTIKVLSKAGIGIDDLVDAIKLLTDLKVTDSDSLVKIAKAIISSAKNPDIIDIDDLVDFLKTLGGIDLDVDALKAFVAAIVDAIKFTDIDCDALKNVLSVIIDVLKGNKGNIEVPDLDPGFNIGDLDIGSFDMSAFIELLKGLGNKDIDLDGLKALIRALRPDFDFGGFDIKGLLGKIQGGKLDLPTLKDLFTKIGIPEFDSSILDKIFDFILSGKGVELPDLDITAPKLDIDIDAFLALLNGLKDKNIDLDGLKKLIINLIPNFDFSGIDIDALLGKIQGGKLDFPTLKDLFGKLGFPDLDINFILGIFDLIGKDKDITLPDLEGIIGKLPNINIDPCDWLKDLLEKIKNPSVPVDPSAPTDPSDPSDPADPSVPFDPSVDVKDPSTPLDPEVQETLEDVDKLVNIIVDESTPQGYVPDNDDAAIANTGDAAIAGVASVTLLAAAAFVTVSKKKEN